MPHPSSAIPFPPDRFIDVSVDTDSAGALDGLLGMEYVETTRRGAPDGGGSTNLSEKIDGGPRTIRLVKAAGATVLGYNATAANSKVASRTITGSAHADDTKYGVLVTLNGDGYTVAAGTPADEYAVSYPAHEGLSGSTLAAGDYFFIVTSGPCRVSSHADVTAGNEVYATDDTSYEGMVADAGALFAGGTVWSLGRAMNTNDVSLATSTLMAVDIFVDAHAHVDNDAS